MEDDVVSMETTQADGKVLPEGGDSLIQGSAIAPQAEVAGNMEMMVMDALDPTLLQMKTEVLDGGGTMTVTGGDEGQIITLQVCVLFHQLMLGYVIFLLWNGFGHTKIDVPLRNLGGQYGGAGRSSIRSWPASAGPGACYNNNCWRAPSYVCWCINN